MDFNDARFEGFKSSGNLKLIENRELLNKIIYLYADILPFAKGADATVFDERRRDFIKYVGSKAIIDSSGMHVARLLNDPAVRFHIHYYLEYFKERERHKIELIDNIKGLITEINSELDKRFYIKCHEYNCIKNKERGTKGRCYKYHRC
jgi:hypothetical protein